MQNVPATLSAAKQYLETKGYEILDQGFECHCAKTDLVAIDNEQTLAFIDVFTNIGEFVAEIIKREAFEALMISYLKNHRDLIDMPIRYDTLSVLVLNSDQAIIRHEINALA